MNDWMLTADEIESYAGYDVSTADLDSCAKYAQRKLLEHLINLTDVIGYSVFTGMRAELLQTMLDKLEANNG